MASPRRKIQRSENSEKAYRRFAALPMVALLLFLFGCLTGCCADRDLTGVEEGALRVGQRHSDTAPFKPCTSRTAKSKQRIPSDA